MKISSVFFFRYYLSFLFIFIIESDENTDYREEHHRKKYRGGSYQNIKRLCLYILYAVSYTHLTLPTKA